MDEEEELYHSIATVKIPGEDMPSNKQRQSSKKDAPRRSNLVKASNAKYKALLASGACRDSDDELLDVAEKNLCGVK